MQEGIHNMRSENASSVSAVTTSSGTTDDYYSS